MKPPKELELLPEDWDEDETLETELDTDLDDENWDSDGQYIGDCGDLWS